MRYLSLLVIVLVAGCLEVGDGIFGSTTVETVIPDDVLTIEDLLVIPSPPITAGSDFQITFQVVNVREEPGAKKIDDASLSLYDSGRCDVSGSDTKNVDGLFPGSTEIVTWNLQAPTNEELGGLEGRCVVRFKLGYEFDAISVADVTIVSPERLENAQRAGESITTRATEQKGAGPIKIDIRFDVAQPIVANTVVPVTVIVEDKGNGLLNGIDDVEISFEGSGPSISCDKPFSDINGEDVIPLIKKKTPPIKCSFTAPSVDDIQTLFLKAEITGYDYEFHREENIKIQPTYEGVD